MKSRFIKTIIALVFLVIFNVIFFFGGVNRSEANWCTYAFVTVAYLCLLATPILGKGSTSPILVGSLWLRGLFYFFTELVVGTVIMLANPDSMKWPLIVQGILLAVFLVLQLMSVLANDATTAAIQKQKEESFSRQILIDQLHMTYRSVTDSNLKPILERCLDALRNCPIETCPEAWDADFALSTSVKKLCSDVESGDTEVIKSSANKMLTALQQRNIIIKRCRMK